MVCKPRSTRHYLWTSNPFCTYSMGKLRGKELFTSLSLSNISCQDKCRWNSKIECMVWTNHDHGSRWTTDCTFSSIPFGKTSFSLKNLLTFSFKGSTALLDNVYDLRHSSESTHHEDETEAILQDSRCAQARCTCWTGTKGNS